MKSRRPSPESRDARESQDALEHVTMTWEEKILAPTVKGKTVTLLCTLFPAFSQSVYLLFDTHDMKTLFY